MTDCIVRIHGSYSTLRVGHPKDALVDFTGGISETYNLKRDELPPNLWEIIVKSYEIGSLLANIILVRTFHLLICFIEMHTHTHT